MAGLGTPMMAPEAGEAPEQEGAEPATPEEQQLYEQFVNQAMDVIYPPDRKGQVSPQIVADLKGQLDSKAAQLFEGAEPPLSGTPQDNVAATAVVLTIVIDGALGYSKMAREQDQKNAQMPPEQEPGEEAQGQPEEPGEGMKPESEPEDEVAAPDYNAVLLHGGKALIEELVEVAEAAKIHDFSEQDMEGIVYRAMDLYRVASENSGNPGYDQAGLSREFEGLVMADREGRVSSVLPGLPGGAPMKREA